MHKLERLRFINIGAPDCRMADLTISALDRNGEPVDTVIWLRNGGGKTAMLGLFFAHLLPDAREFLRGRKENAKFADHVLDGDTGYILASWAGETQQPDLFGGAPPRLVTGRVVERKPGVTGSVLPSLFFSFRPLPEVADIDRLPWQRDGRRLSLAAFNDEMQRLNRMNPEIEYTVTDKQRDWTERLRDLRLDPQVFRYQRQMNAGEGEAATGFMQFRTSDEFVDFLLGVVTPAGRVESLEGEIRSYAGKLHRLPLLQLERALIEGALPRLTAHAEDLQYREGLHRLDTAQKDQAAHLRDRLALGVRAAQTDARGAVEAIGRLEAEGHGIRERREELAARLAEVDCRLALWAEEAAAAALAAARSERAGCDLESAAWHLVEPLAQQRRLIAQRDQLTELLERNRLDAAPLLRERDEVGAALGRRLRTAGTELETAATAAEDEAQRRLTAAEACREDAERSREEAAALRRDVAGAQGEIQALGERRANLLAQELLGAQEPASAAITRWQTGETDARARASELDRESERLTAEAATLREKEMDWTARLATLGRDLPAVQAQLRELDGWRQRLLRNGAVRSVLAAEEPDLWQAATAIQDALAGREAEVARERHTLGLQSEDDRRLCASVEDRGTLPASRDAEQALRLLRAAGINSGYFGWDYLRHASDPEAAARLLQAAPELAAGILLNDPAQLPAARALLREQGFQPTSVTAVGVAEGFQRAAPHPDLWPPHAGLYDPAVARSEFASARERLARAESRDGELQAEAEGLAAARRDLDGFVSAYPPGSDERLRRQIRHLEAASEEIERRLGEAAARRREMSDRQRELASEQAALQGLLGRIPGILAILTELAAKEAQQAAWRQTVADGPGRVASLEQARRNSLEERQAHQVARERLIRDGDRMRAEAERYRDEAAGLPEGPFSAALAALAAEDLRERHRLLARAYDRRLGGDAAAAGLAQVEDNLREIAGRLRGSPEERQRAAALLASPEGGDEASRRSARQRAETSRTEAIRTETRAEQARNEAAGRRARAEENRRRSPRPALDVPSAESGERMRRQWKEDDDRAVRDQDGNGRQVAAARTRREQADQRARGLLAAQKLVATVLPEEVAVSAAEPFAGTEAEADAAVGRMIAADRRLRRELEEARSRVEQSAAELKALSADPAYRQLGPAILLRLGEPGPQAEDAAAVAKEMDLRLPGLVADIESAETDRRLVLAGLIQAAKDGLRDLRQIEEASRLPPGLEPWTGLPFIQIHYEAPRGQGEWEARLGPLLQDWVDRQDLPANSGLAILRQAVRSAAGRGLGAGAGEGLPRSAFRITLLKPDAILTTQRYPVETMKYSEGQDLTTAILLYCTFINLRVRRGGDPGGVAGALVLDNPIGKASLEKLIELQRRVAAVMKVQIIAATGVKDREAISHYPKIVGIRPVRTRDAKMKYLQVSDAPVGLAAAQIGIDPSG